MKSAATFSDSPAGTAAPALSGWLCGSYRGPSTWWCARWIFLRLLGLIFFVAFASLFVQVKGLIGGEGVLPAQRFLDSLRGATGGAGWRDVPTLGWLSASDAALRGMCIGGMLSSVLLALGVLPGPATFLCWLLYLSLVHLGQDFLSFQWDILLLETAFLAMFYAPLQIIPKLSRENPPSPILRWLLWWLLFRLMFSSGVVKLDDPTWTHLRALDYHYETQPLPTLFAWYAHQLPHAFHALNVAGMFFIELIAPFLIFAPRPLRHLGAILLISLQVGILLTGNYTFFNYLSIALCLLLFDDQFLAGWRRKPHKSADAASAKKVELAGKTPAHPEKVEDAVPDVIERGRARLLVPGLQAALALFLVFLSLFWMARLMGFTEGIPQGGRRVLTAVQPFFLVNTYGLFAHMTTERKEIIIEGSNDGQEWRPYEFRYKPGALYHAPRWVAPHQPRLDWQMWFAALGPAEYSPWVLNLEYRLLKGASPVLALLESNPFPEAPPRYLRARLFRYHFSDVPTRRNTGLWWTREELPPFLPPIELEGQDRLRPARLLSGD